MKVDITRPNLKDEAEVLQLFTITLRDNFEQEGIIHSHKNELEQEINSQMETWRNDLNTQGKKEYFLQAIVEGKVVGTIAYGIANPIIREKIDDYSIAIPEVKSVYILPEFQSKGIGSRLLSSIIDKLTAVNIHEFYLDSGYKRAQGYWGKKLGKPKCLLKDYWGENLDHMIWHFAIESSLQ